MSSSYFWAGLNGVLSVAIMVVCVCRLVKITRNVLTRVKLAYLVLLVGAAANGMAPWKFDVPGWPSALFCLSVLGHLLADASQWRSGPPKACTTDHAPLEPHCAH